MAKPFFLLSTVEGIDNQRKELVDVRREGVAFRVSTLRKIG